MTIKKRIIIGIILIVFAVVLCFVISPLIQSKSSKTISVIRCAQNIKKGSLITEKDIEHIYVGKYNLQNNLITKEDEIIGKVASCDIYKYDYFTKEKLNDTKDNKEKSLANLNGEKCAYTINISSLASGVGNNLEYGDIVSCICNENGISFIPEELRYLKILSLNTSQGEDYEDIHKGYYSCVTFECSKEECISLSEYSRTSNITLMLVCKYDSQTYHDLGF